MSKQRGVSLIILYIFAAIGAATTGVTLFIILWLLNEIRKEKKAARRRKSAQVATTPAPALAPATTPYAVRTAEKIIREAFERFEKEETA